MTSPLVLRVRVNPQWPQHACACIRSGSMRTARQIDHRTSVAGNVLVCIALFRQCLAPPRRVGHRPGAHSISSRRLRQGAARGGSSTRGTEDGKRTSTRRFQTTVSVVADFPRLRNSRAAPTATRRYRTSICCLGWRASLRRVLRVGCAGGAARTTRASHGKEGGPTDGKWA